MWRLSKCGPAQHTLWPSCSSFSTSSLPMNCVPPRTSTCSAPPSSSDRDGGPSPPLPPPRWLPLLPADNGDPPLGIPAAQAGQAPAGRLRGSHQQPGSAECSHGRPAVQAACSDQAHRRQGKMLLLQEKFQNRRKTWALMYRSFQIREPTSQIIVGITDA
jgi:hypothetical protein